MRLLWDKPSLKPDELYSLLNRHNLLPMHLGQEGLIRSMRLTAEASLFLVVAEGEGDDMRVLASTYTYISEPGIAVFNWVPEVSQLHKRRNELIDLGQDLAEKVWFDVGIRRVEARVPSKRTQTIRALRHMGFHQETLDSGLREAVDYGKGPEGVVVLSRLATDLPRVKREEDSTVEVQHG